MAEQQKQDWLVIFQEFIKYLKIDSKEVSSTEAGGGSSLNLWKSQQIFMEQLCRGLNKGIRSFYCLKSRQLGISTISLAVDIFWISMHPGTIGALVTDTDSNREVFRSIIKRYIESFPRGFFGSAFTIEKDNRNFMEFSNGSRLDFLVAGTKKKLNWGEGKGYALVHLTEVANYGSPEGLANFEEAMAQKNPNRLFIYESTAKGMNHWKDKWDEAGRDSLTKKRIFIGWWAHDLNRIEKKDPRYSVYGRDEVTDEEKEKMELVKSEYGVYVTREQLAWYRWRASDQSKSEADLHQNQPWTAGESFVLSGYSFFQVRVIQKDLERIIDGVGTPDGEPVKFLGYRYWLGNDFHQGRMEQVDNLAEVQLRVWYPPVNGAQYVIGCDPAGGRNTNADRHAIGVYRCFADKLVQCAEYADNAVETRQCAWVLAFLAGTYRNCTINIDLTGGIGRAVLVEFEHLRERMRSDLFEPVRKEYEWDEFLDNARWYLYHRPDSFGAGYAKGTVFGVDNKFHLCNAMRDAYASRLLEINSAPMLQEMLTVTQDGLEIGAPGNAKDDRVFAGILANISWIEWFRQNMIARGYTWEVAMREENSGQNTQSTAIVHNIVANFLKTAEERAQEEEERPTFFSERGLT